ILEQEGPRGRYLAGDIGILAYRAGGTAHDAYCLNDPEAGRAPTSRTPQVYADRVYGTLSPDVLVLTSKEPDEFVPASSLWKALHEHPGRTEYRLSHIE